MGKRRSGIWICFLAGLVACQGGSDEGIDGGDTVTAATNPDMVAIVEEWVDQRLATLPAEELRQTFVSARADERARLVRQFSPWPKQNKIDRSVIVRRVLQDLAQRRAAELLRLWRRDTDLDGELSEDEYRQDGQRTVRNAELEFAAIDLDQNARLDSQELNAFSNRKLLEREADIHLNIARLTTIFVFDGNQDGAVTIDELTQEFLRMETDISAQPADTRAGVGVRCAAPKPSPEAEFVALSLYGTKTLSSVTLGNENRELGYVRVRIEPGSRPIYLAAVSYERMIWHLEGATDRIEHFAVSNDHSPSSIGVVGVAREKLSILQSGKCQRRFSIDDEVEAHDARLALIGTFGRPADRALSPRARQGITVPSGDALNEGLSNARVFDRKPDAVDRATWAAFQRFHPGGVVDVDPKSVVADGAVRRYTVLPQEAGLVQLVQDGKLKHVGGSSANLTYVVLKPIAHWPAGLHGAHSVNFILPRHIPVPEGSVGHSGLFVQATGSCRSHGRLCREITAGVYDDYLQVPNGKTAQ